MNLRKAGDYSSYLKIGCVVGAGESTLPSYGHLRKKFMEGILAPVFLNPDANWTAKKPRYATDIRRF